MGAIRVEQVGCATAVTIDRPEAMNAISRLMWLQLGDVLDELGRAGGFRPVILRGAGDRAFSAGSDLAEFHTMTIAEVNDTFMAMEHTIAKVERLTLPVIAQVGGYALGSALELVCACDIVVASASARVGMPVARLGIMLNQPFANRIAALIGPSYTRYLLYTGRQIPAAEALRIGLVNDVVAPAGLEQHCLALAAEIAANSRHSVKAAKQSVFATLESPSPYAPGNYPPYFIHEADFRTGVAAFLEKRPPRFTGK